MPDIASLGIEVNTQDVSKGKVALDELTNAGGKAEEATKKLADASRNAANASSKAADAAKAQSDKARAYVDSVYSTIDGTSKLSQANKTLEAASQQATAAQTGLSASTNLVANAVKLAVIAFAGLRIVDYIRDATLLQARYETLGVVMGVVGRNAGYSGAEMKAAAEGVQKLGITMIDSRQQITRMVQAQIDLSKASELARIAQDAGVIANINSSEAFARLIHGIQSGQTEVLRLMGINVSMERSYKDMAQSLGVHVNQLTQTQRVQAVLNSVMREGQKIAGTYEAAMGTAGKQMLSVQRYGENLKLILGETFSDALVIAVGAVTDEMKGLEGSARDLAEKNQLRDWGRSAIMIAANVIDAFRLIKNTFVQAGSGIMFLVEATKLAVTGQFAALKELSAQQEKENKEFVKGITLVSDMAQARFRLIDVEKANAAATENSTKKGKAHGDIVLVDAAAIKKAEEEYRKIIASIREKISVNEIEAQSGKKLTDAQKVALDLMVKIRDGELKLNDAKKIKLVTELEELATSERLVENYRFNKQASENMIEVSQREVMSAQEQLLNLREQNAMMGMTKEQVLALAGSKELELAANVRNAAQYAGPLHDAYVVYANDLTKLAGLQKQIVSEQQIQKDAQEWARIGTTIEQTGKMAFVQFAAHGVDAMKSIGEAIKLSIIDVLYQLTLRKWTVNIVTSMTNSLASGAANGAGGFLSSLFGSVGGSAAGGANMFSLMNIASGAKSLFSAFTGGASSLVTSIGTSALGQALGLGVSGGSALGAGVGIGGLGAGAGAGTAFIGGAGTALGGAGVTSAGLSGAGGMLAAAAGPLAIAAAADMIFRLIAGNKTIKGAEALTYVPVIGPMINALFGMGPKKLGPSELTGNFSDTGFSGQFEADWTRKGGLFSFGKKKGRRGLGISSEQDAALDAMVGNISSVFFELTKVTGDADRSLSGWTMTVKKAIDTEEQQAELTKELTDSIGAKLIPELTLIQQKGEDLSDTAARASAEFKLMNAVLDITGMTLQQTGLASLALRDNVVQMLGGLENAGSMLNSFFENFYTDAERAASTTRLMNAELSKLGITTLPTTREQFRALIEAQDLNTDAGQKMFASLIQLVPAFSSVTDAIGKAADDAAAEAKRIADSIQLLTTDSFKTLFDYTKYIRLAANAGVTAAMPKGPVFEQPAPTFMPSFDVGTNRIPSDMIAKLHKDERVIPAADNRALMKRLDENNETAKQIALLREEQRAQSIAIAKNTSATAKFMEKMYKLQEQTEQGTGAIAVRVV